MPDWNNIFNIAFVAAAAALSLFFLIAAISVAVKGKRRCGAFDVILRILSALAFTAGVALFAAAVLTMLDGSMCIRLGTDGQAIKPTLVFMSQTVELPMPDLFVLMSTTLGSELALALAICSLAALIVDCLVANKRADKRQKQNAQQKSAEQLKREAEIEKIRRIGEQAVRKTENAASAHASAQTVAREQSPRPDLPDATPAFVGIKDRTDDFDTFDDLPADAQPQVDQPAYVEQPVVCQTPDTTPAPDIDAEHPAQQVEQDGYDRQFVDSFASHDDGCVEDERQVDDDALGIDDRPADDEYVEDGRPTDGQNAEDGEQTADEQYTEDESAQEQPQAAWNEPSEPNDYADEAEQDETSDVDLSEIEPDRDIYIPDMRTITRTAERPAAVKPVARGNTAGRPASGGGKSVETKRAKPVAVTGKKPAPKKTASQTAKPTQTASRSTPQKSAPQKPAAATAARRTASERPAPTQKLPVTKRYVILDRRNAVNMFGEYLKERDREAKDKLTSSINTIIIE